MKILYPTHITQNFHPETGEAISDENFKVVLNWIAPQLSVPEGIHTVADFEAWQALEQAKAEKLNALNEQYEEAAGKLTAGYPLSEQRSWTKQETEARAYQLDASVSTPYLSMLAEKRGIPFEGLPAKIIKKADAFILASAAFTGRRQKLEDEIEGAQTLEALNALSLDLEL